MGSSPVRSGFTSRSRGSLPTPPGLECTCNGGSGGQGQAFPITVKLETKALRQCCEGRTSGLPCQPNVFVPPSPDKTIPNHRITGDIIGQALTRPRLRNPRLTGAWCYRGGAYGGFARMLQTTVTVQNMMLCGSVRCGGPLVTPAGAFLGFLASGGLRG